MGEATVKYFDYMPRCGEALQARLGRADLATKIPLWRKHGTEDPDAVVTGCRNIAKTRFGFSSTTKMLICDLSIL